MSILRANFDGTPFKAVPHILDREDHLKKAEYRYGACVKSVEDMGKTIKVRFEDVLHHTTESISADLVLVADGSNSSMRKQFISGVSRQYAGYVSRRGTVRENLLEECHRNVFKGNAIFHLMDRSYIHSGVRDQEFQLSHCPKLTHYPLLPNSDGRRQSQTRRTSLQLGVVRPSARGFQGVFGNNDRCQQTDTLRYSTPRANLPRCLGEKKGFRNV
jgi:2-polyprenyl-6-methoxyphenol hydroxylase-like FAD-dependent oxidoreductase